MSVHLCSLINALMQCVLLYVRADVFIAICAVSILLSAWMLCVQCDVVQCTKYMYMRTVK